MRVQAPLLGAIAVLASLSLAMPAYAEVMDKEPAIWTMWTWVIVASGLAYLAGRRWPWTLLVSLGIGVLYPVAMMKEDLDLGGAIAREAPGYYRQLQLGVALLVVAHLVLFLMWLRKVRHDP